MVSMLSKPSFLRIFQEVNTEDGRGLLVSIETKVK